MQSEAEGSARAEGVFAYVEVSARPTTGASENAPGARFHAASHENKELANGATLLQ